MRDWGEEEEEAEVQQLHMVRGALCSVLEPDIRSNLGGSMNWWCTAPGMEYFYLLIFVL